MLHWNRIRLLRCMSRSVKTIVEEIIEIVVNWIHPGQGSWCHQPGNRKVEKIGRIPNEKEKMQRKKP